MPATSNRGEGSSSIATAFASLSVADVALPSRFADLKRNLIKGNEEAVLEGWKRLLRQRLASDKLDELDSSAIPEVEFEAIVQNGGQLPKDVENRLRQCGTVIVRGLVDVNQALAWKQQIRDYVQANPQTKGFPAGNIQVYELYWSKAQLEARSHANMLLTQTALNRVWTAKPQDPVDLEIPLTYCDRLRMRTVCTLRILFDVLFRPNHLSREINRSTLGRILTVVPSSAGRIPSTASVIPISSVEIGKSTTLLTLPIV